MNVLHTTVSALWHQDLAILSEPHIQWIVYAVMFTLLLLENGVLPAAFLPGDSLLFLAGALIARGTMPLIPTLVILTCAASLGCWLGYAQGRWLSNTRIVKSWLSHLPAEYYQRATGMFHRHGLSALLAGRFLAFVRTILPALAGISGLKSARFQIFNWLSGLVWVVILVTLGYGISQVPFIQAHEQQMMQILLLIPAVLLLFGLAGSLLLLWKKRHAGQF